MKLELNIYEKKQAIKTYTADTYDLMFGTVEDLIDAVNLDKLETGSDTEIIKLVGGAVIKGVDKTIKPLLKDVFDGLTDEELKKTKVKEIVVVIVEVLKFAVTQISNSANPKN